MKKLLAILSVVLFANQASALDFDEWVGFECFRYDFKKQKHITNEEIPVFFAVMKNNKEFYWERRPEYPFNICKDVEFSLRCENSKGDHISVHRFTNMVAYDTKDMENFLIYKCNLVEQKF